MQIVFEELKLNYEDYLVSDPRFYRPAEVEILVADPSKAREKLGWKPKVTFEELALSMVRSDYENLSNGTHVLIIYSVNYTNDLNNNRHLQQF
jgi:GDPmannose 4,6-dehydratase